MSKTPRKNLLEMRKKDAAERQVAWDALSPKEKLAVLDQRLGKGQGAVKQRAALKELLQG